MLIGIDASRATSTAPTGTEAYSQHLIRALLPLLPPTHRARLYFRTPPQHPTALIPAGVQVEQRIIPFPRLWTHLRLSWEMLRFPPAVLFVPAHVLPLIRPQRTLVTVHDVGYRYFPEAHPPAQRRYLDWSTRWNVRRATHVLADSAATRDAIVQAYHVKADKITVAYPGYDSNLAPTRDSQQLAAVRARYAIPGDYVLALGRIHPRKNLARLVGAFAQVLTTPRGANLTLVLAGLTGWLAEPILARIRNLGLEARVRLPGYVAAADKAALISGARVFAYPSLYEGFGFPALEAQACDVPLLASQTSSLPEVVGEGGLLINPLDEDAIAQALLRLLTDTTLCQHLVAKGRANLRRFSWAVTAQHVLDVMQQLMGC